MNLKNVEEWAEVAGESADALRSLRRIPARLGLLDADMSSLSADPAIFEQQIAGRGYALVSRAKNMQANGRREDSRIRSLLARFHAANTDAAPRDNAVYARYSALMDLIETHEGGPGSGARWNNGRHRTLCGLRARALVAPEHLTQEEIDRIGREMTADKRKGLRKAVTFLNSLADLTNEMPELRAFLPAGPLASPAGSSRARRMNWDSLPAALTASFEEAADRCLAGEEDLAAQFLARIEAGEDAELVMSEADKLGAQLVNGVGKPAAAREHYRQSVVWLVRSWQDAGGEVDGLMDIRELFQKPVIEAAIRDQISRSNAADDLRDPLSSATLKTRLTGLVTLARRGLEDPKAVAIIKLLQTQHYDIPRKKLVAGGGSEAIQMDVDMIFSMLRQRPSLASVWSNAPSLIADIARRDIEAARAEECPSREVTALRKFAGAVAYAVQLSRPMRTACLRHVRIASLGEVHANLLRSSPDKNIYTFKFSPFEIKNDRSITVDVAGRDADILREWIDIWRPRMIAVQHLDAENVYLFPGSAVPAADAGDPIALPRGCYSPSAFLNLWADASSVLGVHVTPHRMRHVVALLILAARPGDYAFVSAVLGNTEATARHHYGRDDGQAAARAARAAMLAEHPALFQQLNRRHAHER